MKKPGRTSNPNVGTHGRGGLLGRPGTPRPGQSASRRPITASRPETRPRPPVLFDAADTSRDAQKLIARPPQPFENPFSTVNVPAPANRNFSQKAGLPSRNLHGGTAYGGYEVTSKHSVHAGTKLSADEMAAIGYGPNDTKPLNPIHSGFPLGAKKQAGKPGSSSRGASSRELARTRQTGY